MSESEKMSVDLDSLQFESFDSAPDAEDDVGAYHTCCYTLCDTGCETVVCCYPTDGNGSC